MMRPLNLRWRERCSLTRRSILLVSVLERRVDDFVVGFKDEDGFIGGWGSEDVPGVGSLVLGAKQIASLKTNYILQFTTWFCEALHIPMDEKQTYIKGYDGPIFRDLFRENNKLRKKLSDTQFEKFCHAKHSN